MAEVALYAPVKRFLEGQGYVVKGEIGACDLVAVRGEEPPVVVELKERLELALLLQAVDRLVVSDAVYVAFRAGGGAWRTRNRQVRALLRRLCLGLLLVDGDGNVEAVLDPTPYRPRKNARRRGRLLKEFVERVGDPELGGSTSRKRFTAYRQDAVRCARVLAEAGELTVAEIRSRSGVKRAGTLLLANHYGWFERVVRGRYALSPRGQREWTEWPAVARGSG